MKVSCSCLTYGRPEQLEEAIESFLRQDFPADQRELVVWNTMNRQKLIFKHPNVRIINEPIRPATLGETRNRCISQCLGEFILTWDDDDIYLPGYIRWLATHVGDRDWIKQNHRWSINAAKKFHISEQATNQVFFRKGAWQKAGGYPHMDSGEDRVFMDRLRACSSGSVESCSKEEIGFIYRFGLGPYNISGIGPTVPGRPTGMRESERLVLKKTHRFGTINLRPHWTADYDRIVKGMCQ